MTGVKAYKGMAMEGPIASWYARNTGRQRARFEQAAHAVAARVAPGARVLEVAPGPGYLAIELARRGYEIAALDISQSFVRIARANARQAGVAVDVRCGNAAAMPFADGAFDYAICMAAFKNFADPVGAIDEIYRVLKPGGEASIIDLRKDASPSEIDAEIRTMHLSPLNARITRWTFDHMLLKRAYTRDDLDRIARRSRFQACAVRNDGVGFEMRLTKPRASAAAVN